MTECAGLEIRYTLSGYRGFESLTLRKKSLSSGVNIALVGTFLFYHYLYIYLLILFFGVFSNSEFWISIADSLQ